MEGVAPDLEAQVQGAVVFPQKSLFDRFTHGNFRVGLDAEKMAQGGSREDDQDTPVDHEMVEPFREDGPCGKGFSQGRPSAVKAEQEMEGEKPPEKRVPGGVKQVVKLKKPDKGTGCGTETGEEVTGLFPLGENGSHDRCRRQDKEETDGKPRRRQQPVRKGPFLIAACRGFRGVIAQESESGLFIIIRALMIP